MIYTITFNPALDYIIKVPHLVPGEVNRTTEEKIMAGGKGINVSIVLHNLGIESTVLGFKAGFTGEAIEKIITKMGCASNLIDLPVGNSRINVKLKGESETEINGQGPQIPQKCIDELYEKLDKLNDGDSLVMAGSIPSTLPSSIYCDIMEKLSAKDLNITVDATNDLLVNVLKYKPFLIKPNHHELGEIFNRKLTEAEEIRECAQELQKRGARNVLVSRGGDGAVLVGEDGSVFVSEAPKGKLVNSTGAGDSMVAGFLAGYMNNGDLQSAFRMGLAAGSASAFSQELATRGEIETILNQINERENMS